MRNDPFNRSQLPMDELERLERVRLWTSFADAVLSHQPPTSDSMMFVAASFAKLKDAPNRDTAVRDFLRTLGVLTPRGSHRTLRAIIDELKRFANW